MELSNLFNNALKLIKKNSPEILTALGVGGVVTTGMLTAKASFKASVKLQSVPKDLPKTEKAKIVWKDFIPPVIAGAATITCIIGASRSSSNRTAAAVATYTVTQKAFDEYRRQVVNQVGKGKERRITDNVAQEIVNNHPAPSKEVILWGYGEVLCCELHTHRYFKSDMESLRRAENVINAKINRDLYVALDELYDILGLPNTSQSNLIGWDSDQLLELRFTTTIAEDGTPCLAFAYNYLKPI